jgi:hypothetical protein
MEEKQDWKLPDPPHGRRWMNEEEWTETMLSSGPREPMWRPLLYWESVAAGDMMNCLVPRNEVDWIVVHDSIGKLVSPSASTALYKTRRPLP